MRRVAAYRTTDGKLFVKLIDAENHERTLSINSYMNDNPIYGGTLGCKVYADDIREWISENPVTNKRILIDLTQENN